jgi:tRNA(Ile)-lysidine synthase
MALGEGKGMRMNLVSKVQLRMEKEQLVHPGDAVVVAVSGGPDSVALLHVLFLLSQSMQLRLVVAHLNHGFRGAESDEEAEFVTGLAASLKLPCEIGNIDVPSYIEETSLNPQAAAREKRYDFLHEIADQYGAARIALAHHADDQAETVLMRVIRGTGPSGLAGIPERRREKKVELIRPLLRIYKAEVIQHCEQYGLSYRIDSSNNLRKYFRNQVRLDIMPMLKQYNEQLPESLNRLAEMMHDEDGFMESKAEQAFAEWVMAEPSCCRFSRLDFARLHLALQRRLIKLILSYLALPPERIDFTKIELARKVILQKQTSNVKLDIFEHICLLKEYDDVRFQALVPAVGPFSYQVLLENGEQSIQEAGVRFRFSIQELLETGKEGSPPRPKTAKEAYFDLMGLALPLVFRNRLPGDRIEAYGLNGSKKVKDMFIDAKLPPSQRDAVPLLVDVTGQVLWIPGFRRSKHAAVGVSTKHLLHVELLSE